MSTIVRGAALALSLASLGAQTPTWSLLTAPTAPPARFGHRLVYDAARDRVVLVGGADALGAATQTWEWNGGVWSLRSSATPIANRSNGAGYDVVYDAARQVTLLVIGDSSGGNVFHHEWNGTTWTQRTPTARPPGRFGFALAYDSLRQRTVMFGGVSGAFGTHTDTWEFDGATWTQRSSGGPRGRYDFAMTFDAARGVTLLFGGRTDITPAGALADTWEWNGSFWLEHFGIAAPPARHDHTMTYDSTRGRVILFGGWNAYGIGGQRRDTFEWNGSAWTQQTTALYPNAALYNSIAYDPVRQHTMLFGGQLPTNGTTVAETWLYVVAPPSPASFSTFGQGCPGPVGTPTLAAAAASLPRLGQNFVMRLSSLPSSPFNLAFGLLGSSNTTWSGQPLPLALDPLGLPGCQAFIAPEITYSLTNSAGQALWALPVPNTPRLAGLTFFAQGVVLAPGFNPGGMVVSNAGQGVVGSQ